MTDRSTESQSQAAPSLGDRADLPDLSGAPASAGQEITSKRPRLDQSLGGTPEMSARPETTTGYEIGKPGVGLGGEQSTAAQNVTPQTTASQLASALSNQLTKRLAGEPLTPAERLETQIRLMRVDLGLDPTHDHLVLVRVLYEQGRAAFEELRGPPCPYAHEWKP